MSCNPSNRPSYTDEQLTCYLQLIGAGDLGDVRAAITKDPLKALTRLQKRSLCKIPFGNVALHYSPHKTLSLDSAALYHKLVERRLGGYCMENSAFFEIVLRSFGYEMYSTGARAYDTVAGEGSGSTGWSHMVNLVTINDKTYVVDIGFGGRGSTQPLPLEHGFEAGIVPDAQGRLVFDTVASHTTKQKMWIYQFRNSPQDTWGPAYCFNEVEFTPNDFKVMNFYVSQCRQSWFTYRLVMMQMILDEETEEVTGTLILVGSTLGRRLHGKKEKLDNFKSEAERVEGLAKWFGVALTPDEIRGINGMPTQLDLTKGTAQLLAVV